MQPTDAQIGFVLLGVLLIFREMMFWYHKGRNGNGKGGKVLLTPIQHQEWHTMARQTDDLHRWHEPEWADEPGQKVWYTDRLLRKALEKNNELLHKQNVLLTTLIEQGGAA